MENIGEQLVAVNRKLAQIKAQQILDSDIVDGLASAVSRLEDMANQMNAGVANVLKVLERALDNMAERQAKQQGNSYVQHIQEQRGVEFKDSTVHAGKDIVGGDAKKTVVIEGTIEEKKEG